MWSIWTFSQSAAMVFCGASTGILDWGRSIKMSNAAAGGTGRATAEAWEHTEGRFARAIEARTARMPSDLWLGAALASMGVSLALQLKGKRDESLFIGQWAAPFLVLGVYNKLVKIAGSDRVHAS
jgi:hypothetical protein